MLTTMYQTMSLREMGKKLGYDRHTIANRLRLHGIVLRPKGGNNNYKTGKYRGQYQRKLAYEEVARLPTGMPTQETLDVYLATRTRKQPVYLAKLGGVLFYWSLNRQAVIRRANEYLVPWEKYEGPS
jgi:hypothetical protein